MTSVLQLHIALADIEPVIWRRVLVRETTSLASLHLIIQEVLGWQNYHLYAFTIGGTRLEGPGPDSRGADLGRKTLKSQKLGPGAVFNYTYDFGDDWRHEIRVEERVAAHPDRHYPCCVDGERAGPPEDCGGLPGYQDLVRILANPADPEYADMDAWVGGWTPEVFDLRATNRILQLAFPASGVR